MKSIQFFRCKLQLNLTFILLLCLNYTKIELYGNENEIALIPGEIAPGAEKAQRLSELSKRLSSYALSLSGINKKSFHDGRNPVVIRYNSEYQLSISIFGVSKRDDMLNITNEIWRVLSDSNVKKFDIIFYKTEARVISTTVNKNDTTEYIPEGEISGISVWMRKNSN